MKTKLTWRILALTIIFSTLVVSPLLAEEPLERVEDPEYLPCCLGDRYGGNRGRYYRSYDDNTTETLQGEIIGIDTYPSRRGAFQGTHLMVKTNQETIEVHLAPSWFLAEQDIEITPQEKITVIGSRINIDGEEVIMAREIKKGDRTLVLRDRDGIPMWRGWRRNHGQY